MLTDKLNSIILKSSIIRYNKIYNDNTFGKIRTIIINKIKKSRNNLHQKSDHDERTEDCATISYGGGLSADP